MHSTDESRLKRDRAVGAVLAAVALLFGVLVAGSSDVLPRASATRGNYSFSYDKPAQESRALAVDSWRSASDAGATTASGRPWTGFAPPAATGLAAAGSGARFVGNSAGEVTPYVRGGTLRVEPRAAQALTVRAVDIGALDDLVSTSSGFRYYHDGRWKIGYDDPAARLFVGTVGDRLTTVIQGSRVNANYIRNLQAVQP